MTSTLNQKVNSNQPVLFAKVWQHPYVNLFKQLGLLDGHHCKLVGDVKRLVDPTLNKPVLVVRGAVSAANYIELPGPGGVKPPVMASINTPRRPASATSAITTPAASSTRRGPTSLGLTGEYLYIQLRTMADKYFVIHVDVLTIQGLTVRLSISNIFKYIKLMNHGRVLQLPCDFLSSKWSILALHLPSLLDECSNNVASLQGLTDESTAAVLKYKYASIARLQFCSNLLLKNVLTSDQRYTINTFPKEVAFMVGKGYTFDDLYEFFWIITPSQQAGGNKSARVAPAEGGEGGEEQQQQQGAEEENKEAARLAEEQRLKEVGESQPIVPPSLQQQHPFLPAASASQSRLGHSMSMRASKGPGAGRRQPPQVNRSPLKGSVPVRVQGATDESVAAERAAASLAASTRSNAGPSSSSHAPSYPAAASSNIPLTTAEFDAPSALPPVPKPQPAPVHRSPVPPLTQQDMRRAAAMAAEGQMPQPSAPPAEDEHDVEAKSHMADWGSTARSFPSSSLAPSPSPSLPLPPPTAAAAPSSSSLAPPTSLPSDPLLKLDRIIGYTPSRSTGNLVWSPDGAHVIYPVNNVLVIMDVKTGHQEFLTGHTAPIHLVSVSSTGIVASGQEGKMPLIRLWNLSTRSCIGVLLAHSSDLRSLSFSYLSLMLAAVGRDAQGRVLIVVWDLSSVLENGAVHIVAKQLSDYGINRLLFSPYRTDALSMVSCGHESIRFWRISRKHCPGTSLALNEHSRNTFTDLAFEAAYGEADLDMEGSRKRLYVATASGSVFQINYARRTLECIYKLHSGPIYSLSINEGFCVTGSGDGFVRVWPLDFSDFFLQAQHKAAVTQVALSGDGLQVLVGSDAGTIGILDLSSTAYQTRMRSHLAAIYAIAFDPHRDEFATVGADGTIRVWGLHSLEQIYEFVSPGEVVYSVAYHPLQSEYRLACGFGSGSMRIMDIATTSMHVDYQQHQGRVLDVLFSRDGGFLYSNGEDGCICAYDVSKNYLPVRMFTTYRHQPLALPPSVHRTWSSEQERLQKAEGVRRQYKNAHDERNPFLSHHLERARQEEMERDNPSLASFHSASHGRHCSAAGSAPDMGLPPSSTRKEKDALQPLPAHALAITDDGTLLTTIGAEPTSIVLLATDTLRQVRLFTTLSAAVSKLLFAAQSTELVAVLADGSFQRFRVADGQCIAHVRTTPAQRFKQERAAAVSGISGSSNARREIGLAFSAAGGASLPSLPSTHVSSATLSRQGLYLLTGSTDSTLRVWDYYSKPHAPHFQTLLAHQTTALPAEGVTSLSFTNDGRKLVSTGADASVWIWNMQADEQTTREDMQRKMRRQQEQEDRWQRQDERRNQEFDRLSLQEMPQEYSQQQQQQQHFQLQPSEEQEQEYADSPSPDAPSSSRSQSLSMAGSVY